MQIDRAGLTHPLPTVSARFFYPWENMEIGDSFFRLTSNQRMVSAAACSAAKRFGMKFTTKKEGRGVRVWRVA